MKSVPALSLADVKKQVATLAIAERYFDSFLLFGLFELGAFRLLAGGPRTLAELQRDVGGDPETLRAMLDAAVAVRILQRAGEAYAAPEELAACLGRPDSRAYLGEWVAFLHALAAPLARQADAVRTGRPQASLFEDGQGDVDADRGPARAMTRALDAYARTRGDELARRLDFSATRRLLDLGCGPGTYSLALVAAHPGLRATLLDLPGPIAVAAEIARERGLAERVELVAADARTFAPAEPYDAVLISNVLHMIGPAESRALLARAFDFVAPGGRLIVQAEYLDEGRTSPRWPALLNLLLRVATPAGRNHSLGETREWLREAGFVDVEHRRLSAVNVNSVLVARRPAERTA